VLDYLGGPTDAHQISKLMDQILRNDVAKLGISFHVVSSKVRGLRPEGFIEFR
jgi:hypothetical protein